MAYTSEAINFLQGTGKSSSGYTLKQILLWDDDSWENEHDFIQWIFPNDKASNFNPDCPVLDAKTINLMKMDPKSKTRRIKGVRTISWILRLKPWRKRIGIRSIQEPYLGP